MKTNTEILDTPHRRYKSNFAALEDKAVIFGTRCKEPWTLRDIMRAKKEKEKAENLQETLKYRRFVGAQRRGEIKDKVKFTRIKKIKGGWHFSGMGNLPLSFEEAKLKARSQGYNFGILMGREIKLA